MFVRRNHIAQPSVESEIAVDETISFEDAIVDLYSLTEDQSAMEALSTGIERLDDLYVAMESQGLSAGMLLMTNRHQELTGTIAAVPGLEALYEPLDSGSTVNVAAMEGVLGDMFGKVKEWASSALNTIKGWGSKLLNLAGAGFRKISEFFSWMKNKTFDAARAGKEWAKAHPVAATLAAVAGLAVLGGAISMIWSSGGVAGAIKALADKVPNIKFSLKGQKVVAQGYRDATGMWVAVEAKKSGWTGAKISEVVTKARDALKPGGLVAKAWEAVKNGATSKLEALKKIPGKIAGKVANVGGKVSPVHAAVGMTGDAGKSGSVWASLRDKIAASWTIIRETVSKCVSYILKSLGLLKSGFPTGVGVAVGGK